jgi:hypothetical protein
MKFNKSVTASVWSHDGLNYVILFILALRTRSRESAAVGPTVIMPST